MPRLFEHETAITIDHDENTCRIDTTMRGVASKCLRMKFREVTKPNSAPYRRFVGLDDQIKIRKTKAERPKIGFAAPGRKIPRPSHAGVQIPSKRTHMVPSHGGIAAEVP